MHLTAHLDLDLIALDRADDVTCLVQLTAPMPDEIASRPGQALVIVLDRSGSMADSKEFTEDGWRELINTQR